jgi:hypothetical protein
MAAPRNQPLIKQAESLEAAWKRTVARLTKIQSHLATAPRGGKLKDKVCIVTGVGSLKGIGCAAPLLHARAVLTDVGKQSGDVAPVRA